MAYFGWEQGFAYSGVGASTGYNLNLSIGLSAYKFILVNLRRLLWSLRHLLDA